MHANPAPLLQIPDIFKGNVDVISSNSTYPGLQWTSQVEMLSVSSISIQSRFLSWISQPLNLPSCLNILFICPTIICPTIICPTHHLSYNYLSYTSFVLHIICPTIICPTHHLSYTSVVLHIICPTHHLSYTSFVLHIICPTHHKVYTHTYTWCYILFILSW